MRELLTSCRYADMPEPVLIPAKPWQPNPDWWLGPSPLLVVPADEWDFEPAPCRGRPVVRTDTGEVVRLGAFLFAFRKDRGMVFCVNDAADRDAADVVRQTWAKKRERDRQEKAAAAIQRRNDARRRRERDYAHLRI